MNCGTLELGTIQLRDIGIRPGLEIGHIEKNSRWKKLNSRKNSITQGKNSRSWQIFENEKQFNGQLLTAPDRSENKRHIDFYYRIQCVLIQNSLKFSIEFSRIHPTCNVSEKNSRLKKTSNLERNSKLKKKLNVSANPFGRVAENRSNF